MSASKECKFACKHGMHPHISYVCPLCQQESEGVVVEARYLSHAQTTRSLSLVPISGGPPIAPIDGTHWRITPVQDCDDSAYDSATSKGGGK